jgi:hypothetical protein
MIAIVIAVNFVKGFGDGKTVAVDIFLILCLCAVGAAVWRGEHAGIGAKIGLVLFGLLLGANGGVAALRGLVIAVINFFQGIGGG